MGIHYIYIFIGVGTLILNAILIYFYIKSNKISAYKNIPSTKKKPELYKMEESSTLDDDDFTMNIDNSKEE